VTPEETRQVLHVAARAEAADGTGPLDEATLLEIRMRPDDVRGWVRPEGFGLLIEDQIHLCVDPDQRDWLAKVLRRAKKQRVPWVVVQGHVPVLGPVRTRFSSGLTYEGSDLWQLMRKHDVDAYLCGEVHDHTVIRRKGVVQMCHGGLFYRGESSYVLGQVTDTKLMLETRYLQGDPQWSGTKLWSTEGGNGPRRVVYRRPSRVVGTYVLKRDPERPARSNRVKQARGISGAKHQP